MKNTFAQKVALMLGLTAATEVQQPTALAKQRRSRGHREKRQCLATGCTKKHNHNNAYCSAECCKEHRKEKKAGK